jgi:MoxR-like ATPase
MNLNEKVAAIRINFERINTELTKIIVGQNLLIKHLFTCLISGGHALIEGVPGLGKTLIVRSLSKILDLKYSRIQFTPDLMPADILGTNIVKEDGEGSRYFEFYKGPIFGQLILADEINRASPKTQSALLEAMQEEKVTIFGTKYHLEPPFMVLATQNPIEMEGTYPLPEAQVDRFFFKLKISYPDQNELLEIIDKTTEDYKYKPPKTINMN